MSPRSRHSEETKTMSEMPAQAIRIKAPAPVLPDAGQDQWERWSTRGLLALLVVGVAAGVMAPKLVLAPQGTTMALQTTVFATTILPAMIFPPLLAGVALLLLIIKMHLASQRRLLREVSTALLAATSRLERLEQFSFIDSQTELFNRRYLDHLFHQQAKWLNRSGRPVTMLLFELPGNAKEEEADHLILEAAQLLRANFRGSDYVLRIAEKQFLVLLPETSEEQSRIAIHRLNDRLDCWNLENQRLELSLRKEGVTCTPGVSLWESLQALEAKLRRAPASAVSVPATVAISHAVSHKEAGLPREAQT
jgi:diguanylate cyclase (GGDEF)-like protein